MSIAAPPSGLQPEDYDEIEAAVMETARGRWFLAEYARRTRAAESESLRVALAQIVTRLDAMGAPPKIEAVPIVERLDTLAWKLRESGVDDFVCGKIEALTREIAAGGVVLNVTAAEQPQQPATPIDAPAPLFSDEETPGAAPPSPPDAAPVERSESKTAREAPPASDAEEPQAQGLSDVIATTSASDVPEPAAPAIDPRLDALLWLDRLPLLDRMALFA